MANIAASPNVDIYLNGNQVPDDHFLSYTVERDMYQPDMAQIVLSNQGDTYSVQKIGDKVEIKVGGGSPPAGGGDPVKPVLVYSGEIVGVEPIYKGGEKSRILIRCMNKLHRLLRKRKSMTYVDMTDEVILSQVVGDSGLQLKWKHDKSITYKHVYQHNLSDLEFLRMRAARMGCHVWCVEDTVYCQQPQWEELKITLTVDQSSDGEQLRSFTPRLSSHTIVKKVTVKAWNPETKELITGVAEPDGSKLGKQTATDASNSLGDEETFVVDQPVWSPDEANALAKARLVDLSMNYVTGEAEVTGTPAFDLAKVITITANSNNAGGDPFNGKYYIMGLTHRHFANKSKDGGYTTVLRLARDAQEAG